LLVISYWIFVREVLFPPHGPPVITILYMGFAELNLEY